MVYIPWYVPWYIPGHSQKSAGFLVDTDGLLEYHGIYHGGVYHGIFHGVNGAVSNLSKNPPRVTVLLS
jgi:hypothetical protein